MIAVDFQQWFQDLAQPSKKTATEHRKICVCCHAPLSDYLDAYYGKDPFEARMCSPCRKEPRRT